MLTITNCNNANSFAKVSDELLIKIGNKLNKEAKSQVVYYEYIAQLPAGIMQNLTYRVEYPVGVACDTSFLKDTANLYESNPEFWYYLVVGFLKADLNRTNGKVNAEMDEKVINFYRFVATYSPKASMIVLENLQVTGKWWMRKLDSQVRISCFLEDDQNILFRRINNSIVDKDIYEKYLVDFSLAIDSTKVENLCEVSYTYEAIIGGSHPNHKVNFYGL